MGFRDLRAFLKLLEERGRLKRITADVSAELEVTEIADRVVKSGNGPALLFENVRGSRMPVLINAYASDERMAWALGVDRVDQAADRVRRLIQLSPPSGMLGKLRALSDLREVAAAAPKVVDRGPCQEVEAEPALSRLPILKCWPDDGGRYITLPMVITRDPVTGRRNVGMYRMQVYSDRECGMHWQRHKGGAEHAQKKGRGRLEAAVAIGADPTTVYAASAPLPPAIDEFVFAGFLRGQGVELVKCKTVDLEVPAQAEIVLEGYVDLDDQRVEGPFGDHTGYYSLADYYPTFHVTRITHRRDAIYLTTIVGRPPMEDYWLGKATERLFLPLMQMIAPEIVDVNMPAEGVFHNLVIVSIRKRYPGQAQKTMYALWGMGQMMFARNIIVVDDTVNVQDLSEVAWRVTANVDARRDLVVVDGPVDVLDHAAPRPLVGGKLGIDATTKTALDGYEREWPPDIQMSEDVKALVARRWSEYGF
ncbi:MAG: menaquinone biosynthesis decarboxylase [Chloroflexi bacterium]|nr:menaquinone biosynthesis decarboxylase [Chloroflexota bacterium]